MRDKIVMRSRGQAERPENTVSEPRHIVGTIASHWAFSDTRPGEPGLRLSRAQATGESKCSCGLWPGYDCAEEWAPHKEGRSMGLASNDRRKREEVTMTNILYSKSGLGDCNGSNKGSRLRSPIYKDLAFWGMGPSRWSSRSGVSSQKKIFHQSGRKSLVYSLWNEHRLGGLMTLAAKRQRGSWRTRLSLTPSSFPPLSYSHNALLTIFSGQCPLSV